VRRGGTDAGGTAGERSHSGTPEGRASGCCAPGVWRCSPGRTGPAEGALCAMLCRRGGARTRRSFEQTLRLVRSFFCALSAGCDCSLPFAQRTLSLPYRRKSASSEEGRNRANGGEWRRINRECASPAHARRNSGTRGRFVVRRLGAAGARGPGARARRRLALFPPPVALHAPSARGPCSRPWRRPSGRRACPQRGAGQAGAAAATRSAAACPTRVGAGLPKERRRGQHERVPHARRGRVRWQPLETFLSVFACPSARGPGGTLVRTGSRRSCVPSAQGPGRPEPIWHAGRGAGASRPWERSSPVAECPLRHAEGTPRHARRSRAAARLRGRGWWAREPATIRGQVRTASQARGVAARPGHAWLPGVLDAYTYPHASLSCTTAAAAGAEDVPPAP
jgi:hypothetical protein